MQLPIKVEGIIFSKVDSEYEFLLIKRTPEDGGFWQPVTGTLDDGESLSDCLKREVAEETGIKSIIRMSGPIFEFEWQNKKGKTITEYVYAVEVDRNSEVMLDPTEHDNYEWCSYSRAYAILEKENNLKAFEQFKERVIDNVRTA